jgi:hypothetical protein
LPFHDSKCFLKLAIFLKSYGRSFHKTAAVYLKEFKIAEKRKTTEETESKPSNPKLVKKTEPTRNILENICIRSLASRNICPLAKL